MFRSTRGRADNLGTAAVLAGPDRQAKASREASKEGRKIMRSIEPRGPTRVSGGSRGVLNHGVQQVPQCRQILQGCYNTGSHYAFGVDLALVDKGTSFVSDVGKCEGSQWSGANGKVEPSDAKSSGTLSGSLAGGSC